MCWIQKNESSNFYFDSPDMFVAYGKLLIFLARSFDKCKTDIKLPFLIS